jgi:serine/threonine-protein kinase
LRHPNVITVFDFGQDERGVPYLVLEYIEGPTLADLMDKGLDDSRIPDLLDQIAAGLDYAHVRGVIHRDIKPGNVLLTDDGRAVLADFGLAWLLEGAHLTLTGGVIGTPEYMSPEQAGGDPIDQRCDVYSLGVVLYEMLVGERPFIAETPIAVLLQHLQDPPPSVLDVRPELPAAVGDVVARALAKDPAQRFASAGALARAFRSAFTGSAAPTNGTALSGKRVANDDSDKAPRQTSGEDGAKTTLEGTNHWPDCPDCGTRLPYGAGICPSCKYMMPLDQLPRSSPLRTRIQKREVVVNLLPENIRWTPEGLQLARRMAARALREASVDGWGPASIGQPYQLIEGRTIYGSIVESAIIKLERIP